MANASTSLGKLLAFLCLVMTTPVIATGQEFVVVREWTYLDREALRLVKAGTLREALVASEKALDIANKHFAPTDRRLFDSMAKVAQIEFMLGELSDAEKHFLRAAKLGETALGKVHYDLAFTFFFLGQIHARKRSGMLAKQYYERTLSCLGKAIWPDQNMLVTTLIGLAAIEIGVGDVTQGEVYAKRALEISKRLRGEEHVTTANAKMFLGRSYASQKKYEPAKPLLEQGIATAKKTKKISQDELAAAAISLARCYLDEGQWERARLLLEQSAKDLLYSSRTDYKVELAVAQGDLYRSIRHFAASEFYYWRAVRVVIGQFGERSRRLIFVLDCLRKQYGESGETVLEKSMNRWISKLEQGK